MTTPAELDRHFRDAAGGLPGGPARADPAAPGGAVAGGRPEVWGRADVARAPKTAAVAAHPPGAGGVAVGLGGAEKLEVAAPWPGDAVTVASSGDAAAAHPTAVGAINAAG